MAAPRLSLCMIVRDEEEMLPGLLASVDGLWDELIVADTGSTDGTVALLEQAGAKVIPHAWQDDFAAARNASLAPATGQWILFLDADERVSPALKDQIGRLVADEGAGAATVTMRNTLPGGAHHDAPLLRLFRNDPGIRFRHRIHEDVLAAVESFLAREKLAVRHLSGVVDHLGYGQDVATDKNKRNRDQELLRRVLAEDPTDFYCWFKLLESARFWRDTELLATVAAEVEPLLMGELTNELVDELKRNRWSGELAALISQGMARDAKASLAWLDNTREMVRPGGAWHLQRAVLLESLGRTTEAEAALNLCLETLADQELHLRTRAYLGRCRLAAGRGDYAEAQSLAGVATETAPADAEALMALLMFTDMAPGTETVSDVVARHRKEHPTAEPALAEALLQTGHAAAAGEILAALAPNDPPLAMGLLTCALATGRDMTLDVDLDQATADEAFRRWIRLLWTSRQTKLMTVFAENCGSVLAIFPWLEEFLGAETEKLKRG